MIIKCEHCGEIFTDAHIEQPNHCPICGKMIMSEAEVTIIGFLQNNYKKFEYIPLLSTLKLKAGNKKQLVVKCLACAVVLRITGLMETHLSVESYCAGLLRGVLDRHTIQCEGTKVLVKSAVRKAAFAPQPERIIILED